MNESESKFMVAREYIEQRMRKNLERNQEKSPSLMKKSRTRFLFFFSWQEWVGEDDGPVAAKPCVDL